MGKDSRLKRTRREKLAELEKTVHGLREKLLEKQSKHRYKMAVVRTARRVRAASKRREQGVWQEA
jgi:hypothetical protein